ncbi:MAG: diphosphomevalonate decarboxylase [Spirochaetaceae bacterium]|nr:diphosphomevalonate decarboxylase [Spirochaetaceae bacterium]
MKRLMATRGNGEQREILVRAAPSLALVKYWGKSDRRRNLPATSSLAVTVTGLETEVRMCEASGADHLTVDGVAVPAERHGTFFDAARSAVGSTTGYRAEACNNFPGSAGLASSASLFAALAVGCGRMAGLDDSGSWRSRASALARVGSASAARAVWGGFSVLEAGAEAGAGAFPPDHWPDLRLLVAVTSRRRKPVPSREAMNHVAATSPYYDAWVAAADGTYRAALEAVRSRKLGRLGPLMRVSYLRMFGTMLAADPPINYLRARSLRVLEVLERLREGGIDAWETMDAGPQVKIACLAPDVERIRAALLADAGLAPADLIETAPGPGPRIVA